jgi:hypothetical protein
MTDARVVASSGESTAGALRAGGISALLLGGLYLVIIALYARVGAPPAGGGEAWLTYLAGKTTVWWAILYLSVLTDLLFLPVALALYVALEGPGRYTMLLAVAFVGLFVAVDLSVTWADYASLLTLSDRFLVATTDAQRAAYIAAADHASAVLGSRLEVILAIVNLSFGILLVGWVMSRGVFRRMTACLAVTTGVLGLASLSGSSIVIILNAVLATLWLLSTGVRLLQLARHEPSPR